MRSTHTPQFKISCCLLLELQLGGDLNMSDHNSRNAGGSKRKKNIINLHRLANKKLSILAFILKGHQ